MKTNVLNIINEKQYHDLIKQGVIFEEVNLKTENKNMETEISVEPKSIGEGTTIKDTTTGMRFAIVEINDNSFKMQELNPHSTFPQREWKVCFDEFEEHYNNGTYDIEGFGENDKDVVCWIMKYHKLSKEKNDVEKEKNDAINVHSEHLEAMRIAQEKDKARKRMAKAVELEMEMEEEEVMMKNGGEVSKRYEIVKFKDSWYVFKLNPYDKHIIWKSEAFVTEGEANDEMKNKIKNDNAKDFEGLMENGGSLKGTENSAYQEAIRYYHNAEEQLSKSAIDGKYYEDEKYVKSAAGTLYAGVEMASKWLIKLKGGKLSGGKVDQIKEALSKIDKKILKVFNTCYSTLHIAIYYNSETDVSIVKEAFSAGKSFIGYLKGYDEKAVYGLGGSIPNPYIGKFPYIPNNYEGKSAEDVWNSWTIEQRLHFWKDLVGYGDKEKGFVSKHHLQGYGIKNVGKVDFDKLPEHFKQSIKQHILDGQYANGGSIEPHKEVSASINAAIKDVLTLDKYKDLTPMEAGMLYNRFKDESKLAFDSDSEQWGTEITFDEDSLEGKTFDKLYKKNYVTNDYLNKSNDWYMFSEEKTIDFVHAVKNRIETRRLVKMGSDLFPEESGIPELIKKESKDGLTPSEIDRIKKQLDKMDSVEKEEYKVQIQKIKSELDRFDEERTIRAIDQDKKIKAMKAGKRTSESGNTYYEYRENRSDKDLRKKFKGGGNVNEDYYIYVTPRGKGIKSHYWIEGGKFDTKSSAEFQAKQMRKMKDLYKNVKVVAANEMGLGGVVLGAALGVAGTLITQKVMKNKPKKPLPENTQRKYRIESLGNDNEKRIEYFKTKKSAEIAYKKHFKTSKLFSLDQIINGSWNPIKSKIISKMKKGGEIETYLGKELNHPKYGKIKVKAMKAAGSDFGKNKKDRVLILLNSGKKRWIDFNSLIKLTNL